MDIIELTNNQWLREIHKIIVNQKHCIVFGIQETGVVVVPRAGKVDEQLCYDMGYMVYEAFNLAAGVILTNAGDFEIGHFGAPENGWYKRCTESLVNWLSQKGLNVTTDNNDILVDGYKVASTCVTRYGDIDYTGGHIGINTKLEDIKKICTKPMVKVPKGLSEFGITTEEVKEWFLDFCKKDEEIYK